jgi:hypothetical protein
MVPVRAGQLGETIVTDLHGKYYENTYRRNVFSAANAAGIATSVGLATACTGLIISNPVGSTVNVVLSRVGLSFSVAFPAASVVGLMVGYNSAVNVTHTTPVVGKMSNYVGVGPVPVANVDAAATLPTAPVLNTVIAAGLTGLITTSVFDSSNILELEGCIILPPGAYAAIYTSTASGALGFMGSFMWEEVPL